jgi:hypothetical protein
VVVAENLRIINLFWESCSSSMIKGNGNYIQEFSAPKIKVKINGFTKG